jgi:DNA-binding MarR family transcriptional regulator
MAQSPFPSFSAQSPGSGTTSAADTAAAGCNFYNPDGYTLCQQDNIGYILKTVYTSINRMIDQGVAPLGLTAMQWKPMVLISSREIDTPAELARAVSVDTGAMTRTLDRLEAKGFLTRHRSQTDRRVVKLELTASGRNVVAGILPAVAHTLNAHLSGFSRQEVDTLISLLRRMEANGSCANPQQEPEHDAPH